MIIKNTVILFLVILSGACTSVLDVSETEIYNTPKGFPDTEYFPVASPYFFCWFFGDAPDFDGAMANGQEVGNVRQLINDPENRLAPVDWTYGPNVPNKKTEEDYYDFYMKAINDNGFFFIDEWQYTNLKKESSLYKYNPIALTGSVKGLSASKKNFPESYIIVAWRDQSNIKDLIDAGGIDMLLITAFTHVHKKFPRYNGINDTTLLFRIDKARRLGIIENTIPLVGEIRTEEEYHENHMLTEEELERQVKLIRKYGPEMPGIAFYGNTNPELAEFADYLCFKYYVEPAPDVEIEILSSSADPIINISYSGLGSDGREIKKYLVFLNNEIIYEGQNKSVEIDREKLTVSENIITVQAIDSEWNRGVASVPLTGIKN